MSHTEEVDPSGRGSSSVARFVRNVIGALVIGALGSGLWELALRDVFFAIGNGVLSAIGGIWRGYIVYLHANIGKLQTDLLIVPIFSLVVVVSLAGPFWLLYYLRRRVSRVEERLKGPLNQEPIDEKEISNQIGKIRRVINWQLAPLVVLVAVLILIQVWQISYTRNASTWSERSIEILAPAVGNEEALRLRAQLRAVDSASQFYSLEKRLKQLAKTNSIILPEFTAIGSGEQ